MSTEGFIKKSDSILESLVKVEEVVEDKCKPIQVFIFPSYQEIEENALKPKLDNMKEFDQKTSNKHVPVLHLYSENFDICYDNKEIKSETLQEYKGIKEQKSTETFTPTFKCPIIKSEALIDKDLNLNQSEVDSKIEIIENCLKCESNYSNICDTETNNVDVLNFKLKSADFIVSNQYIKSEIKSETSQKYESQENDLKANVMSLDHVSCKAENNNNIYTDANETRVSISSTEDPLSTLNHPNVAPNSSEFNCPLCPYKGNKGRNLRRHMKVHLKPSEADMLYCNNCSYQSIHKTNLRAHVKVHMSRENLKMFSCNTCTYKTVHKSSLRIHKKTHMNQEDLLKFHCNHCSYRAKRKLYLIVHMKKHIKSEDISNVFQCSQCLFKTRHKFNLVSHMKVHMKPENIIMFQCSQCSFKTKYRSGFTSHVKMHMRPEDIDLYQCYHCSYKTLHKTLLKSHMKIHINPEDIERFQCNQCSYKAKRKDHLFYHMKIHKKPEEVPMFQCSQCSFKTRHRSSLNFHMKSHLEHKEIDMLQCSICCYKGTHKKYLTKHMKLHLKQFEG